MMSRGTDVVQTCVQMQLYVRASEFFKVLFLMDSHDCSTYLYLYIVEYIFFNYCCTMTYGQKIINTCKDYSIYIPFIRKSIAYNSVCGWV